MRDDFCKDWFPLFQSETADFFGIVCSQDDLPDAAIIHFSNYDVEHSVGFVSLERCLESMLEALKKKVFTFNSKTHFMNVDTDRFGPFMASLNPETQDTWKDVKG